MNWHKFYKLLRVNNRLQREGDGCPWDLEQTHTSLRPYMLEEACEAIDAIDEGDAEKLKEELGDVLYQVIFHSKVAEKSGTFTIGDVCDTIREKLIRRHPHVFSDKKVKNTEEVMTNWDKIKDDEKGVTGETSFMDDIPRSLPALQQAEKIQEKAARTGFDWDDIEGPLNKLHEEIDELIKEIKTHPQDTLRIEDELGDILFAAVNVARFCHVRAELALRRANKRFINRFKWMEKEITKNEKNMKQMTLAELDTYWERAKLTTTD